MKRKPQTKRVLLVEGDEDKRVIPELIEATGITWETQDSYIVGIEALGSIEKVLKAGEIETRLKGSGLLALGVLIDADDDVNVCWQKIKNRIEKQYPNLPDIPPPKGFITQVSGMPKFGAWIMPDNTNRGMLETFLLHLRPESPLLELSTQVPQMAKQAGALFIDSHADKAQIYSWLAWQNPPGRQMHNAIQQQMLTEKNQLLLDFVEWFCSLYDIENVNTK